MRIASICPEEDSLPKWARRCPPSDARSGGVQAIQVSLKLPCPRTYLNCAMKALQYYSHPCAFLQKYPYLSETDCSYQDSAVVQDPNGDGQVVYLFLPLYKVHASPHHTSPILRLTRFRLSPARKPARRDQCELDQQHPLLRDRDAPLLQGHL